MAAMKGGVIELKFRAWGFLCPESKGLRCEDTQADRDCIGLISGVESSIYIGLSRGIKGSVYTGYTRDIWPLFPSFFCRWVPR